MKEKCQCQQDTFLDVQITLLKHVIFIFCLEWKIEEGKIA